MFHIYLARALAARLSAVSAVNAFFSGLESSQNIQASTWTKTKEQLGCSMYSQVQSGIWPNSFQVVLRAWRKPNCWDNSGGVSQMARVGIGIAAHGGSALNLEFLGLSQHIPGKAMATTCKFMLGHILPIKAPVSNFKKLCSKGVVWSSSCCGLPEGKSNIWFSKLLHLILRLDVAFKYSSMGVLCVYTYALKQSHACSGTHSFFEQKIPAH